MLLEEYRAVLRAGTIGSPALKSSCQRRQRKMRQMAPGPMRPAGAAPQARLRSRIWLQPWARKRARPRLLSPPVGEALAPAGLRPARCRSPPCRAAATDSATTIFVCSDFETASQVMGAWPIWVFLARWKSNSYIFSEDSISTLSLCGLHRGRNYWLMFSKL